MNRIEQAIMSAGICSTMPPIAASRITQNPIHRNLPMPESCVLMVEAIAAMPAKITAVPPKAYAISVAPSRSARMRPSSTDSQKPMKKVNASSTATPAPLFLVRSMP